MAQKISQKFVITQKRPHQLKSTFIYIAQLVGMQQAVPVPQCYSACPSSMNLLQDPGKRQRERTPASPALAGWGWLALGHAGLDRPAGQRKPAQAASYAGCVGAYALMSCVVYTTTYVVDVLRGQPIKLIQVVSTSDFMNFDGTTLFF